MNLKFLSVLIGTLIFFTGTSAWAGGSAAIILEGPGFNAEAELAIRDTLAPSGLTIESRDTIEAARAFASSGDAGWNKASLQSLRGAIGCDFLLVFEQKVIGGEKYALRVHIAFEGGVGTKVMSTEKANLHKALAQLTTDAFSADFAAASDRATRTDCVSAWTGLVLRASIHRQRSRADSTFTDWPIG